MGCAVFEGSAQLMHDLALLGERQPQGGEGRARDVATEMLQTRTVPSLDLEISASIRPESQANGRG